MAKSKSKRNKKAKPKRKRPMKAQRLSAVRRIERADQRAKAGGSRPVPAARAASPAASAKAAAAPPRVEPAVAKRIERARALGLSVSVEATPALLDKLEAEFHLVDAYVRAVWAKLVGDHADQCGVSAEQLSRFAAELCGDGRLMSEIAAAQQRRADSDAAPCGGEYRHVAKALREHYADALPRSGLLSRLLGH